MGATRHHLFDTLTDEGETRKKKKKHSIRMSKGKEPNTLRAHAHETRLHLCGTPTIACNVNGHRSPGSQREGPLQRQCLVPDTSMPNCSSLEKSHVHFGCRTSKLTLCFNRQRTARGVISHSLAITTSNRTSSVLSAAP